MKYGICNLIKTQFDQKIISSSLLENRIAYITTEFYEYNPCHSKYFSNFPFREKLTTKKCKLN